MNLDAQLKTANAMVDEFFGNKKPCPAIPADFFLKPKSAIPAPVEVSETCRAEAVLQSPECFPEDYARLRMSMAKTIADAACVMDCLRDSAGSIKLADDAAFYTEKLHSIAQQIAGGRAAEIYAEE